ncbi:MAG TPA: tannase/feruloyl esterase family alpha/beta hydrolase [Bryobacteraceae bacterium]|nr:tannase/feruloyl esterase family alpha/beta hydrolase [Bryobacteraceae bacterium]
MREIPSLCLLLAVAAPFALARIPCADMLKYQAPGVKLAITKADATPAAAPGTLRISPNFPGTIPVAVPAFCHVEGVMDQRTGVDGKPYGIGFALALPDEWNGRFLFQGGGGLNGNVALPLGSQAAGDMPALARGFAVVTTDSGHKGSVFDGSFFRDQEASLNFYYVAIGKVAPLAKQMIASYYGRAAEHSYFDGCSTGGREAMIMSQRYPEYFDGIISGDPAIRTGHSNLALGFITAEFDQAAPKDASDKPDPKKTFSDSDRKLIVSSVLQACDAKDGLKDGMIFNQRACDFDPAALVCAGAKAEGCLTRAQADVLKKAFAGPKSSHGDAIYPGFPFDAGIADVGGIPGLLGGPVIPVQTGADFTHFDTDREAARVDADQTARLGDSLWTNLSSFSGHGGKLLFYHGLSDPWFSPLETLRYYEKMADETSNGSAASWSRLYFVPGMGHCQGGSATLDQFDMLSAVVDWVEKGVAPDRVIATGHDFPGRSRPLCPYPQHAEYMGHGDSNDASNFVCKN